MASGSEFGALDDFIVLVVSHDLVAVLFESNHSYKI